MKKIFNILLIIALTGTVFSCSQDRLETEPSDKVSGVTLFKTVEGAQVAMDGVYKLLFEMGWSSGNTQQNFGILSTKMFTSLMGEDYLQDGMGSGWFYFDYKYNVRPRYTSQAWRSYATWNFYYTLINNVNYIIPQHKTISGEQFAVDNVIAQALTMRAYAYFQLIQLFQQTYVGHEKSPGVPLYTEPTTSASVGKGRGTVEEVYKQINADLNLAIKLFAGNKIPQAHKSNLDFYLANAIKANVSLVQNNWNDAAKYAAEALKKPGLNMISDQKELLSGFNSVKLTGVMWGSEVITDQADGWGAYFSHLDASVDMYGAKSRKCIYSWLYSRIPKTDLRLGWWNGPQGGTNGDPAAPVNTPYNQLKFRYSEPKAMLGDFIYMRAEEMKLVEAEALCHAGNFAGAKAAIESLVKLRDPDYKANLDRVKLSKDLTMGSIGRVSTLMDYIILQRRIELWGESERIFDILRLKTGFDRNAPGTNHSFIPTFNTLEPASKEFILTIPQKEFDGNPNMDSKKDQNPM